MMKRQLTKKDTHTLMHWHILGAGAIGLLWAGKLLQAGHPVTLILRDSEKLDAYRENQGFSIRQDSQTRHYNPPATLASGCGPIDNLLITTKAFAVLDAFASVHEALTDSARILLLHNGMGPQQALLEQHPQREIWAGSTTDGAYFDAPWQLVQAGAGSTVIGELSERSERSLAAELRSAEASLSEESDIAAVLWRKLAINCAINPLTAIYNCRNGDLLKYDDRRAAMAQICREVEQIARARDIPLFDRKLMEQAWDVAELTAANHSSMQQDMSLGRRTEIEEITGFLCRTAELSGIAVPANQLTLDAVRGMSTDQ